MSEVVTCAGCNSPRGGLYVAGCRQCSLRSIVRGPEFHAAHKARRLTPAYQARLLALGDIESVHAEVKAMAANLEN